MNPPVLSIRNLSVSPRRQDGMAATIDQASFDLYEGEVLALVGESGCGKTKTAEAIMGLLPGDAWKVQAEAIDLMVPTWQNFPKQAGKKSGGVKFL